MLARLIAPVALLAAALGACSSKPSLVHGCTSDSDCGDALAFRCDLESETCLCRTSDACPAGELCNAAGYCQAKIGCYETQDCPEGNFCDPSTNLCLPDGRCASDLDCPAGQLCDATSQLCKAGCRVDGDCALRQVCLCSGPGDGGTVQAPCACDGADAGAACAVGSCADGTCRDQSYCPYGEVCAPTPEGGLPSCQSDFDSTLRPFCANCDDLPGQGTCGQGANFCLFSTYTSSTFCGVDCSQGQACPNGYDCEDVIVVWSRTECTSQAECMTPDHRSSIACQTDADCPNQGLCGFDPGAAIGFCYGQCVFEEGASESFCACVGDDDCAQDTCSAETQTCSISRRTCDPNGLGCTKIRCVESGGQGGCLIGQNCAPIEGLTCSEVRPP